MQTNQQFDKRWLDAGSEDGTADALDLKLSEIRDYAYQTFEKLDLDGSGYIEIYELENALDDRSKSERERSFISFLLNNINQIAEAFDEGWSSKREAISKQDIEQYFKLVLHFFR